MNNKTDIEEDIKICKETIGNFKSATTELTKDIFPRKAKAIENILADRERYKRLAEQNLKDSEEFKNNMCNHRCIRYTETLELQAKVDKYDSLVEEIQNKIAEEKEELKHFIKMKNDKLTYRHAYAKNVLEELLII